MQVVLCDIGWSDLGTWGSLKDKLDKDDQQRLRQRQTPCDGCQQQLGGRHAPSFQKLVAIKGLDGYIVVDTPHALLICPASDEQWIKELVGDLKRDEGEPLV